VRKSVIFIHGGGGQESHDTDEKLVASLRKNLGEEYAISYPLLPNEPAPDFGRSQQISKEISCGGREVIFVAHSLGASMVLKFQSRRGCLFIKK
jgi:hypothetical protein